jgi:NAD(P)H-flavin reductase
MHTPADHMTSIYAPRACRLLAVDELTPQEKLFRLQPVEGGELHHQPGQFVQVSLPGLTEAPFSVANSPTRQGYFELGVRAAGLLTTALHQGSTISILLCTDHLRRPLTSRHIVQTGAGRLANRQCVQLPIHR